MADPDDQVAFLSELFPNLAVEFIFNSLLQHDCDLDETIKYLLEPEDLVKYSEIVEAADRKDLPQNPFDYLISTFPDVEIEAIEAFLLTHEIIQDDEYYETLESDFMQQCALSTGSARKSSRDRDRDLKMTLSDFSALLKTSQELSQSRPRNNWQPAHKSSSETFDFTFLEIGDETEWEEYKRYSGKEMRQIASDLQAERIDKLRKAAISFKSGNMTGRSTASYYSDQGHALGPRIARFHRIAAEKLFIDRNGNAKFSKCIDLHYLTVDEAQSVTSAFVKHHDALRIASIQIITGRGNHSSGYQMTMNTSMSLQERFFNLFTLSREDKLTKEHFDECVEVERAVRSASIFSSNEDSTDLQPSHAKYLIADFLVASVMECSQNDRLEYLKMAHNYYLNFLSKCMRYDVISKEHSIEILELKRYFVEDRDSDDVREERFVNWLKSVPRDLKIDRMRKIIRLKSLEVPKNVEVNTSMYESIDAEEGSDNVFWVSWINCCILMCLDRLGLLLREVELLESGEEMDMVKVQPANADKKITKIDKPFKLVKDRKQVAEGVFKHGHNLPTMTIDEYLDLERKRGNIITGGGAASAVKMELDEDDELVMEAELRKAREFDEVKDMYSRGSGNTYNRS